MSKFDSNTLGNNLFKTNGSLKFHLMDILNKKHITRYALAKATNILIANIITKVVIFLATHSVSPVSGFIKG